MEVSEEASIIFSLVFEHHFKRGDIDVNHLIRILGGDVFSLVKITPLLNELISKGWLFKKSNRFRNNIEYCIPGEIIQGLIQNKLIKPKSKENLTNEDFFKEVRKLSSSITDDIIDISDFNLSIKNLIDVNPKLPLVEFCNSNQLSYPETLYLTILLDSYIETGGFLSLKEFFKYFNDEDQFEFVIFLRDVRSGKNRLLSKGVITLPRTEFKKYDIYEVSKGYIDKFLEDVFVFQIVNESEDKFFHTISPEKIKPKELFFNDKEKDKMENLQSYLQKDNYKNITDRLIANGCNPSMVVTLYGEPGTGKTESVYQLGRNTNRKIYSVDLSSIRGMYYGESERNIKGLFKSYQKEVEQIMESGETDDNLLPILFINECDSILSKRVMVSRSVDTTHNSIQNILLDELDSFKGILIMTTNHVSNFDPAFERRIIYKINLSSPDVCTRQLIWKSKLNFLTDDELEVLGQYEMSGGQINNVVIKSFNQIVLSGDQLMLEKLIEFCEDEVAGWVENRNTKLIGFSSYN